MSDPIFTDEEIAQMTPEERLDLRMDGITSDTFYDILKMMDHEVDRWIESGITDEDALAYAKNFTGGAQLGEAFAAFLRYVPARRAMRGTYAKVDAVLAKYGWPEDGGGYSFDDIADLYSKMDKGGA